jgi:hypothetical protein
MAIIVNLNVQYPHNYFKFKLFMDILNIIELSIKSLKKGTRKVLVWLEKGTKLETRCRKKLLRG